MLALFAFAASAEASIDHKRLKNELEFLRQNAFLAAPLGEELKKPESKTGYFDRSQTKLKEETRELPENIVDLDQLYFSDSVKTRMAAPATEPSEDQAKE